MYSIIHYYMFHSLWKCKYVDKCDKPFQLYAKKDNSNINMKKCQIKSLYLQ